MTLIAVLAVRTLVGIDMAFRAGFGLESFKVELAFAVEGLGLKALIRRNMAFSAFDVLMLALDGKARPFIVGELAMVGELAGGMARYAGLVGQDLTELISMLIGVAAFAELVCFARELEPTRTTRRLAGQHIPRDLMAFGAAAFEEAVSTGELKGCLVVIEGQPLFKRLLGVAFPTGLAGKLPIELFFVDTGVTGFAEARLAVLKLKVTRQLALQPWLHRGGTFGE